MTSTHPQASSSVLECIDIVSVGTPSDLLRGTIEGYQQRLLQYVTVRVCEIEGAPVVASGHGSRSAPVAPVSDGAQRVAATIAAIEQERGAGFPILLCDFYGEALTSEEFARRFLAVPYVCAVVGGIFGLHEAVGDRQLERVSFGRVTLPGSLARIIVIDQFYRALRLAAGEPYDLL